MGQDRNSVEQFFNEVVEAWKANDGAAFAGYFVEDGSLINPFGERADGHDAIAGMYKEYFAGMLQATTSHVDLGSVRIVGSDYAFVDGEQTIYGPDGGTIMVVHLSTLLQREGDSWRFVDSRPYAFAAPPG
jgi:uncharacterized protein (TIGR02246 family)